MANVGSFPFVIDGMLTQAITKNTTKMAAQLIATVLIAIAIVKVPKKSNTYYTSFEHRVDIPQCIVKHCLRGAYIHAVDGLKKIIPV